MKKLLIILVLTVLLCGCQKIITETQPDHINSTATETVPLSSLTDYELLCAMAQEKVCLTWATCSYMGEYPFSTLMEMSPEFAELMTRKTAAESIKTFSDPLEEQFPGSMLPFLAAYLPQIEEYIDHNLS